MEPNVFSEIGSLILFSSFTTTPAIKPAAMPPKESGAHLLCQIRPNHTGCQTWFVGNGVSDITAQYRDKQCQSAQANLRQTCQPAGLRCGCAGRIQHDCQRKRIPPATINGIMWDVPVNICFF